MGSAKKQVSKQRGYRLAAFSKSGKVEAISLPTTYGECEKVSKAAERIGLELVLVGPKTKVDEPDLA